MDAIVAVSFLVTILCLICYDPRSVFVYLFPFYLIMIPPYYFLIRQGYPDLNFMAFGLTPFFLWWILEGLKDYRLGFGDFLVVAFCLWQIHSQYEVLDFREARNMAIFLGAMYIMPYVLTRHFFRYPTVRARFFRALVIYGAILAAVAPFEFKYGLALSDPLHYIWPQKLRMSGLVRYGHVRVASNFGHPIHAGLFFGIFVIISVWLWRNKLWTRPWQGFLAGAFNMMGLLLSVSRGPLLGAVLGGLLMLVGWWKWRVRVLVGLLVALAVIGWPVVQWGYNYVSVPLEAAEGEFQRNAAYRYELIEEYIEIIDEEPIYGYTQLELPVEEELYSIDNQFIWLGLTHGYPAIVLFCLIALWALFRSVWNGFRWAYDSMESQLSWLLFGVMLAVVFTFTTVWMGNQTGTLFVILVAMVESLSQPLKDPEVLPEYRYTFKRVL